MRGGVAGLTIGVLAPVVGMWLISAPPSGGRYVLTGTRGRLEPAVFLIRDDPATCGPGWLLAATAASSDLSSVPF